jgi:CubicO group peptidase (beta-lactamase class C family)
VRRNQSCLQPLFTRSAFRDHPVSKYLPDFEPNEYSFPFNTSSHPRITLHDLAAHLSGLGRDWPPGEQASNFPHDVGGNGPPPDNGLPFPVQDTVLAAVRKYNLVHPPSWRPSYSNTGPGVLGMALLAADRAARATGEGGPDTVAQLLRRDVFIPLGMNGSHFLATPENLARLVVPAVGPEYTDLDFADAMNPSGGAFSSLHDLTLLVRSLLRPDTHPSNESEPGVLVPNSVARFLRPDHAFEEDDWSEAGAPWEIVKHVDGNGRRRRVYWKCAF